eukprot:559799-Pleurochrysis_carterae.AAC.1
MVVSSPAELAKIKREWEAVFDTLRQRTVTQMPSLLERSLCGANSLKKYKACYKPYYTSDP